MLDSGHDVRQRISRTVSEVHCRDLRRRLHHTETEKRRKKLNKRLNRCHYKVRRPERELEDLRRWRRSSL